MPGSQFQSPQGVTALHTPLLTAVVPGANPGAGTIAHGVLVRALFSKRSTSGIDEETVPKTAAPRKGVQSAILWCSAIFQPSVAQQQSIRSITERPWSVTTPRDHFKRSASVSADHSPLVRICVGKNPKVASRLRHTRAPNAGWLRQMSGGLKIRRGWRATHSSDQFRGIDVTASMSVFQTERVGAAPTCRTNFQSSQSVRVMHTAVRRRRLEVQVLVRAPS
jgi:hypothetical protein